MLDEHQQSASYDFTQMEQEYQTLRPNLENFSREFTHQLNKLLEEANISLGFPIQDRVKTWESVRGKIERYPNRFMTVKEIHDLVGVRVILLFSRDVTRTCDLITKNFVVSHQDDTAQRLGTDQFGYSSIHYTIELPKGWLSVPTLTKMGGLIAEVQVRTLAQHIWAEISHKLQYKQENSVPPTVLRAISRASALLETIDLEFERVLSERELYRSDLQLSEKDENLNVDSLEKVLDALLPNQNKKDGEPFALMLEELKFFGVTTREGLTDLINKHLRFVLRVEARQVSAYKDVVTLTETDGFLDISKERLKRGVFYSYLGLLRELLRYEFGQLARNYFDTKSYHSID